MDNLACSANIKLVVYSSNTNVYRTDIILDVEDTEVNLETTFNKEDTTTDTTTSGNE